MSEKRKEKNSYEKVRDYILARIDERECQIDPFVYISGSEISEVIGITPRAVNEHVRTLIRYGVIERARRCYYSKKIPEETRTSSPELACDD